MRYTGEYTAFHNNNLQIQESPKDALAFILNSDKSYFINFRDGFMTAVSKIVGESWKSADLHKLFEDTGIKVDDTLKKNIRNWKSGKNDPIREYAIQICFALKLDLEESEDFLCRVCAQWKLNVKDPYEVIYRYCLLYGKSYGNAIKLISDYNKFASNDVDDDATNAISNWLWEVEDDDEEFIRQLITRVSPLDAQSKTVKNIFAISLRELKKNVFKWRDAGIDSERKDEISNTRLAEVIYSGIPLKNIGGRMDLSFDGSLLKKHKQISKNFPFRARLDKLENGYEFPSRKDIILICFFNSFYSDEDNISFDKFHAEMNDILDQCRMSPLYSRSMFDWMILKSVGMSAHRDATSYWNEILEHSFSDGTINAQS